MKRIFNLLAIVLAATLVLSACGAPATTAPATVKPATAAPATVPPVTAPPAATEGAAPAATTAAPQLVIYMQMGGTQGDSSNSGPHEWRQGCSSGLQHQTGRAVLRLGPPKDDRSI